MSTYAPLAQVHASFFTFAREFSINYLNTTNIYIGSTKLIDLSSTYLFLNRSAHIKDVIVKTVFRLMTMFE